ncbi:MAG: hypothetical protein ACPG19_04010 [Saprospiraceae bacterium]
MENHIELASINDYTTFEFIQIILRVNQIAYVERDIIMASMGRGFILSFTLPKLFVHKDEYEKARKLLQSLGYENIENQLENPFLNMIERLAKEFSFDKKLRFELKIIAILFLFFTVFLLIFMPILWWFYF